MRTAAWTVSAASTWSRVPRISVPRACRSGAEDHRGGRPTSPGDMTTLLVVLFDGLLVVVPRFDRLLVAISELGTRNVMLEPGAVPFFGVNTKSFPEGKTTLSRCPSDHFSGITKLHFSLTADGTAHQHTRWMGWDLFHGKPWYCDWNCNCIRGECDGCRLAHNISHHPHRPPRTQLLPLEFGYLIVDVARALQCSSSVTL